MYVRANGPVFELDGRPFPVNGCNCYYAAHRGDPMTQAAFDLAESCGFNVLRTWAFLDVPEPRDFAWFQAGPGLYNDGPNGLELLDRTIALAEQRGILLILPLVNYWDDFGGMNQYAKWLSLTRREDFYTDSRARDVYREWVRHLLLRVNTRTGRQYRDEPAIMAWELANESRCEIKGGCEVLHQWAEEMSGVVKALDGNHLVGLGDEGFFRRAWAGRHRTYNGQHGVDCEALMGIGTLDFGSTHLYPDYEPEFSPEDFGSRWIREHIEAGGRANKPMLIEEYGLKSDQAARRDGVFERWWNAISQAGGAGGLLWMVASTDEVGVRYPDYDQYTIYDAAEIPSVVNRARVRGDAGKTAGL